MDENYSGSQKVNLLIEQIDDLSSEERMKLVNALHESYFPNNVRKNFNNPSIARFKFENVMNGLRSVILHEVREYENLRDISWLLRFLLVSKSLFSTTKEVDYFLSNISGIKHNTKSTGRDRIVDWYLKEIENLPNDEQNRIFFRIAKYIFINIPSSYKEWKSILYSKGSKK